MNEKAVREILGAAFIANNEAAVAWEKMHPTSFPGGHDTVQFAMEYLERHGWEVRKK